MSVLCKWEELPEEMQVEEVRKYYDYLKTKTLSLVIKRLFDIIVSLLMIIVLIPVFLLIALLIKLDSKGPAIFKQVRVTSYGREFKMLKFRSMVVDADKGSSQLTTGADSRITRVGAKLRNNRLDELPQLFNILTGDMSFVGARPEVPRYVDQYTPEMRATLLLPAGVTSEASILFRDEYMLLEGKSDVGKAYVEGVLPEKMKYNLDSLKHFSFWSDIRTIFRTVFVVIGVDIKPV